MGTVERIFKVNEPIVHNFQNPQRQSVEATEDYSVKKVVESREIVTGDHNSNGDRPEVVNVCYGTDATPPTASSVPIGTIYIQYSL